MTEIDCCLTLFGEKNSAKRLTVNAADLVSKRPSEGDGS